MILLDGNTLNVTNSASIRTARINVQNPVTFPALNWPATPFNNLTEGEKLKIELPLQLPKGRNRISFGIGKLIMKILLIISNYQLIPCK